ncbi:MAG: AAA family ATPase [Treponemataceae bacterium]|nr:AAA family ATPase [Treponemataceae bacterium]
MKPVELELVNIGPFTGTTVINFETLGEMFLVTGKTGSGKTTIFDAITYALYGKLSGARSNLTVRTLRSDFCGPQDPCSVRFDFMVGDDTWRVERCPPVAYVNRNGKQDEHPDTLQLYRNGEQINGTKKELTECLESLLTLTVEEFSRIVLLPQGEFSQFLRDNSTKRQETLMKLFPVSLFTEAQKRAKAEAEQKQAEIDILSTQIRDLEEEKATLPVQSRTEAEALVAAATAEQESAQQAVTEREKSLLKITSASDTVTAAFTAVQREEKARTEAESYLAQCTATLAQCMKDTETIPRKKEELKQAEQAAFRITSLMPKADTYWQTRSTYKDTADALAQAKATLAQLQSQEADLLQNIEHTAYAKDRLVALTDRRSALTVTEQKLQDSLARCTSLHNALQTLQKAQETLSAARRSYDIKMAVYQDYEHLKDQERIHWAIGELTASLTEGTPCPVCGSLHHPSPATLSGTITTDEKLTAAKEEAEHAREVLNAAELSETTERATVQAALTALQEMTPAAEGLTIESAPDNLPAIKEQLSSELEGIRNQLQSLRKERAETESDASLWETSQEKLLQVRKTSSDAVTAVTTLEQEVALITADGIAAKADITGFLETAQKDFPQFDVLKNLSAAVLPKRSELQAVLNSMQDHISTLESDIAAIDRACQDARLARSTAETALQGYTESLSQRNTELQEAQKQLDALVQGELPQILDEQQAALVQEQTLLKNANDAVVTAGNIRQSFERIDSKLDTLLTRKKKNEAAAISYQRLNEAINGSNERKIKLDSWILGMYLDQITRYASQRLQIMSEGRFTMHLKDTVSEGLKGRGLKGLDIEIDDYYTGKVRDPASLSGGETFMASLALALALTDVVQEGRGGVQLESLFIDEGFGSLDGDALESALGILDAIRGSRCVGIISHVSELYTRIPTHLEVEKTTTGSSARVKVID